MTTVPDMEEISEIKLGGVDQKTLRCLRTIRKIMSVPASHGYGTAGIREGFSTLYQNKCINQYGRNE